MPNHVYNAIEIPLPEHDNRAELVNGIMGFCPGGRLDFNKLIPTPPHIYLGSTSGADERDFGKNTWYSWCRENWGTN